MKITKKHVGLRVRVEQFEFAGMFYLQGGVVGVIGIVSGKRFGIMTDHAPGITGTMMLTIGFWRITEVLPL